MNGSGRLCLALATLVLTTACATSPRVSIHTAPDVDLARYERFGFFERLGTDHAGYRSLVSEALRTATIRELEARGLRHDDVDPDLRINFNARLESRWRAVPGPVFVQDDVYGIRGRAGNRYFLQPTEFREYPEGSLLVDLVDVAESRLVWEAVVMGPPSTGGPAELREALEGAISTVFEDFPASASGRSGP
ncbi:MAG: DUF4136 domain-containing protein [Pseudomonadales bacterium]|jgi:hypothetical protein|nr:DUF4136 domain-containing protein [Pseudomonadales bacterium]